MHVRMYRALQALILAGLGLAILVQSLDGQILHYLHQRMIFLTLLAGVSCMALAQPLMRARSGAETEEAVQARAPARLWWVSLVLLALLLGQAPHQHDHVDQTDSLRASLFFSVEKYSVDPGKINNDAAGR